jgi:SOS-response transcriptional repressor LexA
LKNRLKEIREERRLTLKELAEKLGGDWALSTLGNVENGVREPSPRLVKRLSEVLKISPQEIVPTWEMGGPESDVRELREEPPGYMIPRKVPVVGFVAGADLLSNRAFNYSDLANQIEEEIPTESKDPNALGLIVEGDSMDPEYQAGDRIVIAPNAEPRNRDVVVARLKEEGAAMLKRFFRTGPEGKTVRLESTNRDYPPIVREISDFRFIYPVVEMQRKARR